MTVVARVEVRTRVVTLKLITAEIVTVIVREEVRTRVVTLKQTPTEEAVTVIVRVEV